LLGAMPSLLLVPVLALLLVFSAVKLWRHWILLPLASCARYGSSRQPGGAMRESWEILTAGPPDAASVLLLPGGSMAARSFRLVMDEPALSRVRMVATTLPGMAGAPSPRTCLSPHWLVALANSQGSMTATWSWVSRTVPRWPWTWCCPGFSTARSCFSGLARPLRMKPGSSAASCGQRRGSACGRWRSCFDSCP
jgi:hypothetical protein